MKNFSFKNFNSSILIILILFFALVGFYLIYVNNPAVNGEQSFFDNLINALMGAMVVALITSSIFIFQIRIEGNQEKEKYIYEKKLELYQRIAKTISEIKSDNTITKNDFDKLRLFLLEIELVADEELIDKYDYLIDLCSNEINKKISEEVNSTIIEFIGLARRELDVLKSVSLERRNIVEKAILTQKRKSRSNEEKFEILKNYGYGVSNIEEQFQIKDAQNRVQLFRKQLLKNDVWRKKLENEGISIDPNIPIRKGSLKKES